MEKKIPYDEIFKTIGLLYFQNSILEKEIDILQKEIQKLVNSTPKEENSAV